MENRYVINVIQVDKAIKIPKESLEALKGVLGARRVAKMKMEAVECPIRGKKLSFVECFSCPNFIRRVRGTIHCKGEPLRL
ncbi:MAG: hypothetical protein QW569_02735 [Candidatus Bathyarchaeia archaeon]|nr:hypothetical protein [Candidatus Bathyarchaeota archaeon]